MSAAVIIAGRCTAAGRNESRCYPSLLRLLRLRLVALILRLFLLGLLGLASTNVPLPQHAAGDGTCGALRHGRHRGLRRCCKGKRRRLSGISCRHEGHGAKRRSRVVDNIPCRLLRGDRRNGRGRIGPRRARWARNRTRGGRLRGARRWLGYCGRDSASWCRCWSVVCGRRSGNRMLRRCDWTSVGLAQLSRGKRQRRTEAIRRAHYQGQSIIRPVLC